MRISDLFKLAAKTLKGRWAALPAIGLAIGMFCLCFAVTAIGNVNLEKSMPCEINIEADTKKITDSAIAEIMKVSDVNAVTPLLSVPATVKAGDWAAELTLTGIAQDYIKRDIGEGSVFPDSSVMPYIVLNHAACKEFVSEGSEGSYYFEEEEDSDELPDIDWLAAEFSVILEGNDKPVTSKVYGILADEDEEDKQQPEAYISISVAKELLQKSGQSTEYIGASAKIINAGCTESVAEAIAGLGFRVSDTNEELQRKWDLRIKEATYLLMAGAFSLLCSAVLIAAWKRILGLERREALLTLRWIGMKERQLGQMVLAQGAIISIIGVAAGTVACLALPSFLPVELAGESVFMLRIPYTVIILSAAGCFLAGLTPLLGIGKTPALNR